MMDKQCNESWMRGTHSFDKWTYYEETNTQMVESTYTTHTDYEESIPLGPISNRALLTEIQLYGKRLRRTQRRSVERE